MGCTLAPFIKIVVALKLVDHPQTVESGPNPYQKVGIYIYIYIYIYIKGVIFILN